MEFARRTRSASSGQTPGLRVKAPAGADERIIGNQGGQTPE